MSHITLEMAEKHLNAWLEAELKVSTGQSYRIGSRQLERANLKEIQERINYWKRQVDLLKGKRTRKVYRAVPRDW